MFNRILFVLFISFAFLLSCKKDQTLATCELEYCTPGEITYSEDIAPIIQQSCATNLGPGTGCHDAWIFEYDNVKARVDDGSFLSVIQNKSMPKIPNTFGIDSLTTEEIQAFECWICDGALEN